ncbi:hypothetical protein QL285_024920 [Trifolium repens]|nr:hypothetical protein QL285_024920 [Trifolium repens]
MACMPNTITSDRDPIFLSQFWNDLFTLQGVALNKSTAYHLQSDGQTKIVNKGLETYLRCMCSEKPHTWPKWISLAEWWYNTNYHSAIHSTPFEIVYGQLPPVHLPYLPGESPVPAVDRTLCAQEEAIQLLKFHLLRAQNRMLHANQHRNDRHFEINDFVFLKLQPYQQMSPKPHKAHKLLPKYYGSFKVIDKVGQVAYKLELPTDAAIHNVFHVSQLKKCTNPSTITNPLIPTFITDVPTRIPKMILEGKMVKRGSQAATKVLGAME